MYLKGSQWYFYPLIIPYSQVIHLTISKNNFLFLQHIRAKNNGSGSSGNPAHQVFSPLKSIFSPEDYLQLQRGGYFKEMQQTSIQRKHFSISHSETRSSKGFLKKGTNILWNLFLLIFMWQPNQYRCQRHFLTGQRCDAICQVAILADSPLITQETYLEKKLQSKSFCKRLTSHHTGNLSRKSCNQKDPGNVSFTDKLARLGSS